MRPHILARWQDAIRADRHIYLTQAGRALVDSHLSPAEVVSAYQLAQIRWTDLCPTLDDLLKESV